MKYILILITLWSSIVMASGFKLAEVTIDCGGTVSCKQRSQRLINLKGEYRSIVHLKDTLRIMASDGGYQSFSYQLHEDKSNYFLNVNFKMKPIIEEINIGFIDRNIETDPLQLLTLKEGSFFEHQKLRENINSLQSRLENLGYPHNAHKFEVKESDDKVIINIAITLGPPRIFKKVKTNTKSAFVNEFLVKKFYNLYNKPFDSTKFKLYLDDAQKELFNYGYYLIGLDFKPIISGERVVLDIKVSHDKLYTFDFDNNIRESRDSLMNVVTDLYRQYKRPLSDTVIKQALIDHYRKRALLNVQVEIKTSNFQNKFREMVNLYKVDVDEGVKTRIGKVTFTGAQFYNQDKLHDLYDREAFELASIDYYDEDFFTYFSDFLKNTYIRKGFVQVKIQGPLKTFDPARKVADIEYNISEGRRAYVRNISFHGLPEKFKEKILSKIMNRKGKPFNPFIMVEDIKSVASYLQENGYYFAEVTNSNEDNIVKYSKNGAEVDIHFIISSGALVKLNRVIYLGNYKTKRRVISKKIQFEDGEIITPTKTREIESALSGTGLFNSVSVSPVRHASKNAATDLVVKVTERDYGLVEFAPGYRTDLGLKLSGTLSYLNIGGMNQSITLRSQINQRLNYQTFDPRRRQEKKKLLEYNNSLTYNWSDVFDTLVDAAFGISYQRKRFYSFDADIFRMSSTLTRDFTTRFSTSLRYQYETITQWDASREIDNGNFKIGAITPSLTYDMRNSQINPVSGAFLNLSCEFANPYFLSQDTSDLTVNYYKLISRNRFYVPFKNGTIAISMVGGVQENLAKNEVVDSNGQPVVVEGQTLTEGYIPNIKVFRLTGMDIVRGFDDEEINRLPSGDDISDVRIQNRAYLANFKIEPRYFLTDNFIGGVFYDAGRVFVDRVDMGELRDSVGVTFKILTPVGTLDFDYGIKLLRKKNRDGTLEDPGRFHVSIGFF